MKKYPTTITNSQWKVIKKFLNIKRKRKHSLRRMLNAIFYLLKTGCQWSMLPHNFPKWPSVYYYFKQWTMNGVIEKIRIRLVTTVRQQRKRKAQPSAAIIDAQSVKSTLVSSSSHTGYLTESCGDGGKKIKGVKRHIVVDTQGLLLGVQVHSAAMADIKGGHLLLEKLRSDNQWTAIEKIFADSGYLPPKYRTTKTQYELAGYELEIVRKPVAEGGFKPVPKRWVVERTFAWQDTNRRLSKSFEKLPSTEEAMVELSAIRNMLKHCSMTVKN
jgi:putative transposase